MPRISPVRIHPAPAYPQQPVIASDPALLARLPLRWQRSRRAASCAGLFALLTLTGCSMPVSQQTSQPSPSPSPTPAPFKVPFFVHGEGLGSFGCVMVAPPVYLTEDDAKEIVGQVAAGYGVSFSAAKAIQGVDIPRTSLFYDFNSPLPSMPAALGTLDLDGYDNAKNIGYEYVSMEDVRAWSVQGAVWSSVEDYRVKDTASLLHTGLQKADIPVAVFYDPMAQYDWTQKDYASQAPLVRMQSSALLRQQVVDFMEWLKSQGVI